ncbi:hypothetical protein Tco_0716307 [Tanacetum coccineum]
MYDWDEEEVSSDDNEVTEVKALMALTDEERVSVCKESANNDEWVKISIQKVHTLLEMEDNNDRKSFLDYLCIDLNYVEEQRNNLLSKHRNIVHELNTCKEQLLVLKQAKLDFLTMQHKKILGIDQLTEDTSNSGPKDLVFIKSSADNSEMTITGSNKPKLSGVEDSTMSNHDTTNESSVCSTPLPPLEKLTDTEPISGPKTIKLILKSKSTFKAETLKGITINEPSPAPVRGNKSSSASKTNSAPTGKLKNVKIEDDLPLSIVMKELNELRLQFSKNKSSYFRNKNSQQVPPNALQNKYKTQFKMNYELCGQNSHLSENCYEVLFCKKCKRTNHRACDHADFMTSMDINHYHAGQSESSSRSRPSRPAMPFPSCIHCGYNDHQSDDCVYYLICEICRIYDHDTHGEYPLLPPNMLGPDLNGKAVNESQYKGMIGPQMNLTTSRPNIQFSTTLCKTSSKHKESHLISVENFQVPKCANKHQSVAMFSTEAEDIAAVECGIYVEVGVNTFSNAIGAIYLPHSSKYVAPPSIDIVKPWFETIMYVEVVPAKGTLKKSLLPPRWRLLMAQIIQCLGDIINKLNQKHREKVVPYTIFLSLLMMHKMKEVYGDGELTIYPTQVFSVDNWALKPNQPEEPPFTDHMLAICAADTPVVFKAPKPSSNAERVPQGIKPGAKPGHKKH